MTFEERSKINQGKEMKKENVKYKINYWISKYISFYMMILINVVCDIENVKNSALHFLYYIADPAFLCISIYSLGNTIFFVGLILSGKFRSH